MVRANDHGVPYQPGAQADEQGRGQERPACLCKRRRYELLDVHLEPYDTKAGEQRSREALAVLRLVVGDE
eukprot:scaffold54964_cov30-Tisochrysis_lutea.AAC.3